MGHRDDADALNDALKEFAAAIPGYAHLPKKVAAGLIRYASVPNACIHEMIRLVGEAPSLADGANFDPDYALDTIEFSAAYDSVALMLETVTRGVRGAVIQRRAEVGRAVLIALMLAKRLKLDVKPLQQALARKQRKRPKKQRRKKA